MKRSLFVILPSLLICALSAQGSPRTDRALTNQDIIKLYKVGLTDGHRFVEVMAHGS